MDIKCTNIDLWVFYLNFTRALKLNVLEQEHVSNLLEITKARKVVVDAYEVAIQRVGYGLDSNVIWTSYLAFLKADKEPQAFLAVRKVFQRAIVIPLMHMDKLWKDYENFEKAIPNNESLVSVTFETY